MSRSFRKVPGWCDHTKGMKRFANKVVRRTKDIPNGNFYKKLFCSYNICDWKFLFYSRQEVKEEVKYYKKLWGENSRLVTPMYKYYMK